MISLYSVKFNNTYDHYGATPSSPTTDQTWLSDGTDALEGVEGYSYTYNGVSWDRYETREDALIGMELNPTIKNVLDYLNNYFPVRDVDFDNIDFTDYGYYTYIEYVSIYDSDFVFEADGTITTRATIPFKVNDLVIIKKSSRNNVVGYVSSITDPEFVLNRVLVADEGKAYIQLVNMPEDLSIIISKMIWYNIYNRDMLSGSNLSSESIGNYSYSKDSPKIIIGGYDYPTGLVYGLTNYKLVRFTN